ncbi:uncharacterized protein BJ212DRAFT_1484734 [Suillus subaureus]|uniref:Helicase ATP-binding domain-containing protein n=1 Tax=Suillus subaureus TaxID=48587 RepID=A0A9P7E1G2_9AGAM|nr:uncharacterized protein BJ212DRAFT_1484734 [Suillus subaureus]KAG1808876.1 hypothetical protein BJ212DRAFT_1484734 [Suillus subaureus]
MNKVVPDDVQILFLQVGTCSAMAFQEFLVTPVGQSFKKIFVDECHDMIMCHPKRKRPWELLAKQFSQMQYQIILLSATFSPAITAAYLPPFDQQEIGFHILQVLPMHVKGALQHFVTELQLKMDNSD